MSNDPFGEYDEIALIAIPLEEVESTLEDAEALGWEIPWPLTEAQKDEALLQAETAAAEAQTPMRLLDRETMEVDVGPEGEPDIRQLRVMVKPKQPGPDPATLN